MYIESHIIEDNKQDTQKKDWVRPSVDLAIAGQESVRVPAEVRTPSSACLRCAYNAYADSLGCINTFGVCPYLAR